MNCIFQCSSPACYEKIYAPNPLEDGEVDLDRARQFEECAEEEIKEARRRQGPAGENSAKAEEIKEATRRVNANWALGQMLIDRAWPGSRSLIETSGQFIRMKSIRPSTYPEWPLAS